jgi:hypothetical protein
MAWSICAIGHVTNGGVSVSTLPIVVLNDRPRDSAVVQHRCSAASPAGVFFVAVAAPAPAPAAARARAHRPPARGGHFQLVQALQRMRADARGVRDQVLTLDHLQRGQRRGGGDGVLLMRVVAVGVGAGHVEALIARDAGRNRQHTAAQAPCRAPRCRAPRRRARRRRSGRSCPVRSGISSKISSVPCALQASRTACQ